MVTVEAIHAKKEISAGLNYIQGQLTGGRFPCYLSDTPDMLNPKPCPPEVGTAMLVVGVALKHAKNPILKDQLTTYLKGQLDDNLYHFFEDPRLLPPDTDTTAYGVATLYEAGQLSDAEMQEVTKRILGNVDESSGKVEIYFRSPRKPAIFDATSTANIMYLMGLADKRKEFARSEEWVKDTLLSGEFNKSSHYYSSPDMFLYFLARACQIPDIKQEFATPAAKALEKRIGTTDLPLDLALRVSASKKLGVNNQVDYESLLKKQELDGSFIPQSYCNGTKNYPYVGSPVITTAFAIEALAMK